MYLVYDYETGVVVARAATPEQACNKANLLTEMYSYINGHEFSYKLG